MSRTGDGSSTNATSGTFACDPALLLPPFHLFCRFSSPSSFACPFSKPVPALGLFAGQTWQARCTGQVQAFLQTDEATTCV